MAEAPDFDQIARQLAVSHTDRPNIKGVDELVLMVAEMTALAHSIAEQLRLVWNARGAADIVKIEADLSSMMGVTASGPYVKNLDRALRSLDR